MSDDLHSWEKTDCLPFPLSPEGPHYEAEDCNPRTWISFRDPFHFSDGAEEYLAVCGRTRQGAVFRRGCAGVLRLGSDYADSEGEGYFVVVDVLNGFAQIRSWGSNPKDAFRDYEFDNLQTNYFRTAPILDLELIAYGNYLELSVSGSIVLSLMNHDRTGRHFGLFSSSAALRASGFSLETLEDPDEEYSGGA